MDTSLLINQSSSNFSSDMTKLIEEILQRHLQPEDQYEVAALLESMGWNDSRVVAIFGLEDVFDLASSIWEQMQKKILFTDIAQVEKLTFAQLSIEMIRNFLRGLIFALPMAVSVVSMITLKFSLWSYEHLSTDLATSIAIGTILSFVCVGGFTQAIARRGFFYIMQGYYNMARRVTFHFIGLGFLVTFVGSILIFILNFLFNLYPLYMMSMTILFFFFLTTIWLSVTVMYILKKEIMFTGLIAAGILIVFILYELFNVYILIAQLIALCIVSLASIILVLYYFKKAESRMEAGIAVALPKMSVAIYSVMPYFFYGFLYFSFLFIDRLVSWSTNNEFMPYLIWFRGEYELGLDFALLLLMLPMGISEVIVSKFMIDLQASQKIFSGMDTEKLNRTFLNIYYKHLGLISITALVSALMIYYGAQIIYTEFSLAIGDNLFEVPVTQLVFIWAIVSYAIVCLGLMNAVILFSLSRPDQVIRAIIPAITVNVTVGFLLSRWFDYYFAIFGLLAGSIVFAILSSINTVKVIKKLDYNLYAQS